MQYVRIILRCNGTTFQAETRMEAVPRVADLFIIDGYGIQGKVTRVAWRLVGRVTPGQSNIDAEICIEVPDVVSQVGYLAISKLGFTEIDD